MYPICPWSYRDMDLFSALLTLCKENPLCNGGLPSEETNDMELLCFLWDAMAFRLHYCDTISMEM